MRGISLLGRAGERRILLAGFLLAAGAVARGEEPLAPGELGTAQFRAEALATLRDKVAADRDEVNQARTQLEERTEQLQRNRNELDRFLRGNDVDPAQIARVGDPEVIEFSRYREAVLDVMKRDWERDWKEARKNARGGARFDESPADADSGWSFVEPVIGMELNQRLWDLRRVRNQVDYANADLERAEDQLDWHLKYYDEDELKRLQELLARVDADGGAVAAPAAPAETPPAATGGEPVAGEAPPEGFGDAGSIAVEPVDGPEAPAFPPATSEALLARFNDACSVRNWALAEATLAEAAPGASWHESGVMALQHERERAAEGDQLHLTRCLEIESAMLGASRRGDWTAVQAFAAQARQEGCPIRAEAQSEIRRSIDQQRRQNLINITMQQMLNRLILGDDAFEPLHGRSPAGGDAPGGAPPPEPPPPPTQPQKPSRSPTGGGPVSGRGGT